MVKAIFGALFETASIGIDDFIWVVLSVGAFALIILFIAHKLWGD